MRKQLDNRIATLIRNNVTQNHRSFFILVGDHGRDQVVNLHFLLSQCRTSSRPSVLWCYKKDLGFTTHRKKREAKIKRDIKRGIREKGDSSDPFELFVSVTDIRYCYYKETSKILGRTFGMLILQDFEAITPNLLARTIETVEGGGVVVLLLRTISNLKQLYSIAMEAHSRYKSSFDPSDPVARFNERFLLSLSSSPSCLILDDELNVLPISNGKLIQPFEERKKPERKELKKLLDDLGETRVVTDIIKLAKTVDQARAALNILEVLASSSLSSTIALTAARGRGKSATLGLCIAAAIAHGYSNIFVTSPSPENLRTLFEFLVKGLVVLGYEEVVDWDLQRGTGEWKDIILRVNIFRGHRQTIQYISPNDSHMLGQAEIVVIDEAAAIPLSLVRKLMGPYLVFFSSTINGYEGTGRSLSMKLFQELRQKSQIDEKTISSRSFKEVSLSEPIRYSKGDQIESWLHSLLCLDATLVPLSSKRASPHPSTCQLFQINRDTLFSFHPASESFLQSFMAVYVSSHYKFSPNDLQLMSDAPGHRLFVLLGPISGKQLPEPLCVIHVALEGSITRQSALNALQRGTRDTGDVIPWSFSQYYQDVEFGSLSGARIVQITVHPHHFREGYGSRALQCLREFYAGQIYDADAAMIAKENSESSALNIANDDSQPRRINRIPPLLQRLSEVEPEKLQWLGADYEVTPSLLDFFKKAGFVSLYCQGDAAGHFNLVQLRSIFEEQPQWLSAFAMDFEKRFLSLLGSTMRTFTISTAQKVLQSIKHYSRELSIEELKLFFSPWDMKRLDAFQQNLVEFDLILDLLPTLATLYFTHRLHDIDDEGSLHQITLNGLQGAVLLAIGSQRKRIEDVTKELDISREQALSLLNKSVAKIVTSLRKIEKQDIAKDLIDDGLRINEQKQLKQKSSSNPNSQSAAAFNRIDLAEYAIADDTSRDWSEAEKHAKIMSNGDGISSVVSIKGPARITTTNGDVNKRKNDDKNSSEGRKKKHR